MVCLLMLSLPADAAHWVVSYTCSGGTTGTDYSTHQPITRAWTPQNTGYSYWTAGETHGSITPVLTWTLDANETVLPPASTTVIAKVSTSANAYISFQGLATSMTVAASDSLDGSFTPTYNYSDYSTAQCGGSGTHYIAIDNAAANTVLTMKAISGSASSSGNGNNPGGYGSVGVSVVPHAYHHQPWRHAARSGG